MAGTGPGEEGGAEHWGRRVTPSDTEPPEAGDLVEGTPEPLVGKPIASPLGDDEPEGLPPSPLWAMKEHRHEQWFGGARQRIRQVAGTGSEQVYLMDDGRHHAMVGRQVGATLDGCQYALVGRLTLEQCQQVLDHEVRPAAAFDQAKELALYGIDVEEQTAASNVFQVARYGSLAELPETYRPGASFQHFEEDLEITV